MRMVSAGLAVAGMLIVAGCGAGDHPTLPATAAPSGTEAPPSPLTEQEARDLLVRVAATGTFIGLPEFEYEDPGDDANDRQCGPPVTPEALVEETHFFATDALPEVHQLTLVYGTAAEALEAMNNEFDSYEQCDVRVTSGQVTDGWKAASIPDEIALEGRAVTATMTIPEGDTFPYAYGCVVAGAVRQCVEVYSRSQGVSDTFLGQGLVASAATLAAVGSTGSPVHSGG